MGELSLLLLLSSLLVSVKVTTKKFHIIEAKRYLNRYPAYK